MEDHLKSRMDDTIAQLGVLTNEWVNNGHVPEVDWTRIRSFDFQDRLHKRNARLKRLEGSACVLCKEFEPHVCPDSHFNLSGLYVYISTKPYISSVSCETTSRVSNWRFRIKTLSWSPTMNNALRS
jgi:hypothetical protein